MKQQTVVLGSFGGATPSHWPAELVFAFAGVSAEFGAVMLICISTWLQSAKT